MSVIVDLIEDENGGATITRVEDDSTLEERVEYLTWTHVTYGSRCVAGEMLIQRDTLVLLDLRPNLG
jgi:hypothetical protein